MFRWLFNCKDTKQRVGVTNICLGNVPVTLIHFERGDELELGNIDRK
jgi:hypothetical protein